MKKLIYLILLLGAVVSCKPNNTSGSQENIGGIEIQNEFKSLELMDFMTSYLKEKSTEAMLLDVRTPPEFDSGYIKGAVLINYLDDDIDKQLDQLDKTKKYYIYCAQGGRSEKCMNKMKGKGFTHVYNLKGGYEAYSKATFK